MIYAAQEYASGLIFYLNYLKGFSKSIVSSLLGLVEILEILTPQ